ncbi:M15 family metallopeptidase [Kineococcus sp. G2]|uniref:M15 family metallopeptidase n=1 Tax=Kineococcus sp. G2 TaxID=3127484 RepID=UPI00301D4360
MEGISGVVSRIAEIQALIGSLQPAGVGGTGAAGAASGATSAGSAVTTSGDGSSGVAFASALSRSLADRAGGGGLVSGVPVAAGTTGTAGAAGAAAVAGTPSTAGARNAAGVPLELAGYGNGKVPAAALSGIGVGSHRMWAPAAQAFERMRAAAARDGVTFGVTDSYRSYDQQVDLARRKGLYSQGGLAAKPGTSEHGWGLSLDLDLSGRALSWMREHADEYGFSENVPRESWHWTFTA